MVKMILVVLKPSSKRGFLFIFSSVEKCKFKGPFEN